MKVLVAGMVAADPHQGGATWAVLQYVFGLRALGHEVELVDPVQDATAESRTYLATTGIDASLGLPRGTRFDVLFNLSGRLRCEDLASDIPIRVYVDLDPVFTQLWHLEGEDVSLDDHTHYATVGSRVPRTGHEWISFLPPVVLEHWPKVEQTPASDAFTTVANWRAYGSVERGGVLYGQKAHSLRPLAHLPECVPEPLELALAIHEDETRDLALLDEHGWRRVDPRVVAGTPEAYRAYVRASRGEIGLAKSGYVAAASGWFSDRSACYLASGRPVIAQDTGFAERLPTGGGLFAFASPDDFADAAASLRADYSRNARAARAIAEEFLDSRRVLGQLLSEIGAAPPKGPRQVHDARDHELADVLGALVVARRPSIKWSSAPLLEVDARTPAGIEPLVVKDLAALADPLREVVVYRDVLAGAELGTPRLRSAAVDNRSWLALERVDGVPLEEVGEFDVWQAAFRWLARLHDRFRNSVLPDRLLRYDAELLTRFAQRPSVRRAAERLGKGERTLVHGDLYPANVLVAGDRICVLDWELSGVGAGALDVASLSTGWPAAEQEQLVAAYNEALSTPREADELARDVEAARLVIAARFVATRDSWRPLPEHAHDFAGELERLSRRTAP